MPSSGCSHCQDRLDKRLENNYALVGRSPWCSRYFFYSLVRWERQKWITTEKTGTRQCWFLSPTLPFVCTRSLDPSTSAQWRTVRRASLSQDSWQNTDILSSSTQYSVVPMGKNGHLTSDIYNLVIQLRHRRLYLVQRSRHLQPILSLLVMT